MATILQNPLAQSDGQESGALVTHPTWLQDQQLKATLATESMRPLVGNRDGTVLAGVVPGCGNRPSLIHIL